MSQYFLRWLTRTKKSVGVIKTHNSIKSRNSWTILILVNKDKSQCKETYITST